MARWRALLALPVLAGLALAQEADRPPVERPPVERDVRLSGTIQLDGRPWPGGRARLQPLQRDADLPEGPPIDLVADERGDFVVQVPSLACRLQAGPGWPEGASVRCEPDRTPARPGEPLVWITWAYGMHGTIHDEDEPLRVEVVSPVAVTGTVVGLDGRPVLGARVTVEAVTWAPASGEDEPLPRLEAGVDAAGEFELRVPAWLVDRSLQLVVRAPGRPLGAARLGLVLRARDPDAGGPRDVVAEPVKFRLAERPLLLAGQVTDLDGRGVGAARLRATLHVLDQRAGAEPDALRDVSCDLEADDAGRFQLEVPPGSGVLSRGPACATIGLEVRAPGFAPEWIQRSFGPASPPQVVRLRRTGLPLGGRVVGPGGPLSGASVAADGSAATTDADGRFRLVAREREVLVVRAPGHAARVVRVRAGPDLEVALEPAGTIAGWLVDPAGQPIAGFAAVATLAEGAIEEEAPEVPRAGEVVALPLGLGLGWGAPLAEVSTDADGRFELPGLPPGVDLRITAGGVTVVSRVGETVVLRQPSAAPPLRCTLRGRAVAAEDGEELHAVWWVRPAEGEGKGCEGRLDLLRDHGPAVTIDVSAPGRVPVVLGPLEVAGPEQDLGDVALRRAGGVALDVRWPDVPLGWVELSWRDPDGRERFTDALPPRVAGAPWQVDGLTPGEVELRCVARGLHGDELGARTVRAVVRLGEETRVALDLGDLR